MKTQTQSIIYAGTIITVLLIIVLALSSFNDLTSLNKNIDSINKTHNSKLVLLQRMSQIIHERSLRMYAMYFSEDVFARDRDYMRFNELAGEFIQLREELLAIGLQGAEQEAWQRAIGIIRVTEPLQVTIVEQLYSDSSGMKKIISEVDLPKENELLFVFDKLIETVQANANQAVAVAEQRFYQAVHFLILMTGLVVALSLSVMFYVRNRILGVEASLHEQMELANLTLENIADGVIKTDSKGRVISLNPAAEHITGWCEADALGHDIDEVMPMLDLNPDELTLTKLCMQQLAGTALPVQRYIKIRRKSGSPCLTEKSVSPVFSKSGNLLEIAYIFRDVTSQKRQADEVNWRAMHDPLTHALNRSAMISAIEDAISNIRQHGQQHALLYVDLDDFKKINDQFGHTVGDDLLIGIYHEMEKCVRKGDHIARMGGDEFVVLLLDCEKAHATNIAEKIRHHVAHYCLDFRGTQVCCGGISVGITMLNTQTRDWKHALEESDQACYTAKRDGKNRVSVA